MLGLRRRGHYGLVHVDGHVDFYQPEADLYSEVASMDLAIVSGRGPALLADIDGLSPLLRDQDIVSFGSRDAALAAHEGSQDRRHRSLIANCCNKVYTAIGLPICQVCVAGVGDSAPVHPDPALHQMLHRNPGRPDTVNALGNLDPDSGRIPVGSCLNSRANPLLAGSNGARTTFTTAQHMLGHRSLWSGRVRFWR